jgi:hypothetical protein
MFKPPSFTHRACNIYRPHRPVVDPQRTGVCTHPHIRRAFAEKRRLVLLGVRTLCTRRLVVPYGQSASHISPNSTAPPASAPKPL